MNPATVLAAAMLATLLGFISRAGAQPLAMPPPPPAAIEQQLGVQLPLEMPMLDDLGRPVRLGDYFQDGRPVLLVLGYYRCPQLCGLLMHGLLEGLQESGLPRREWRIVGVSIDPEDNVATARQRRNLDLAYADFLLGSQAPDAPLDLHLLTAASADSRRLARQTGFSFTPVSAASLAQQADPPARARFAHPASVMVVTPQGRISRYLMGIQFDAGDLKVALADAAGDRIGSVTSRIALLCAHFDPKVGRHSDLVMNGLRALGLTLVALLGAWCWRRRDTHEGAGK
jgi:protein SCO1/2